MFLEIYASVFCNPSHIKKFCSWRSMSIFCWACGP